MVARPGAWNTVAMQLHEVLETRRDVILTRWKERVRGRLVPAALPTLELLDHLPAFLDEVSAALAGELPEGEDSATAADHGENRLRLGFSLDAVVREYAALQEVIEDTAREAGVAITLDEARCLSRTITAGIATAVSEYARQRDAELCRQHNEHVGFIAHELRNPLSTASLALEMLFREGKLSMTLRPSRAIVRALEHVRALVDRVLRDSRIASGVDVVRECTTLAAVLEDTELMVGPDAEALGVGLHVDLEHDGEIFVDVRLVRSALGNLVRNALKYSHRGGLVEVRARVGGELLHLEIEDACGGVDTAKLEQAFTAFVRLDNTTKEGFGLGLAIAKQAVDAHAGTLRVQNVPGKGCIFVMELPVAAGSARREPDREDAPAAGKVADR